LSVTDGAVDDFAYEIPNYTVGYAEYEHGVPIGPWRAPDANWNTFVTESFVDELAHAAGKDPVEFRLAMLKKQTRIANVLRVAAERSNWGQPLPDGRHQGIALTLWETIGAIVAQVSMKGGALRVHHVFAVIDCGTVVNPDIVVAQTQSAIYYGLSAALMGKITIKNGVVQEKNFDSYAVLHMAQAPTIDVHAIPSQRKPSGIGEPALPGIAPAVGNALFFATGKRVRTLPFSDSLTIA
jgi:isoquinoline 1-oxidoreductase beta subunit